MLPPRPPPFAEQELYRRGLHIGLDGSVLLDGSNVYAPYQRDLSQRLHQVDYFHGLIGGIPVCQTYSEESLEPNFLATELINVESGFVFTRLRNLQRAFRARRLRMGIVGVEQC